MAHVRNRIVRTDIRVDQVEPSAEGGSRNNRARQSKSTHAIFRMSLKVCGIAVIVVIGVITVPRELALIIQFTVDHTPSRFLLPLTAAIAQQLQPDPSIAVAQQLNRTIYALEPAFNNYEEQPHGERQTEACRHIKTEQDIRNCWPAKYVVQFQDPMCASIKVWKDVQRCLTGRFQYKKNTKLISEIHIVGERNSGTKFVTKSLQQCFPKSTGVKVHRDFLRSKHFFQPIVRADFRNSLIIVVVRDPIEWMAAMRENPYHSPSHVAGFDNTTDAVIPLPWQLFVNKPWTTLQTDIDRKLAENEENRNQTICQEHFSMQHVVPCQLDDATIRGPPWHIPESILRGYYPFYEQHRDGSGPYRHLLELRSDKIVNWVLQIPLLMQLGAFLVVRYEDLLRHGTESLLRQVADIVAIDDGTIKEKDKLPATCAVTGPQPERIGKRKIPDEFRDWINQNVPVETEQLIGYR